MKASRRTQPYRKKTGGLAGTRAPGSVLSAMLRGKPASLPNPQDAKRRLAARKTLVRGMSARKRTFRG